MTRTTPLVPRPGAGVGAKSEVMLVVTPVVVRIVRWIKLLSTLAA